MISGVTGHRPANLGGYSSFARQILVDVALEALEIHRPDKIITGMALGWDQAIAEAATQLQIPFIAAVPFRGQENRWPVKSQIQYGELLAKAEHVEFVTKEGTFRKSADWIGSALLRRNAWVVDNCEHILAVFDGESPGGTASCVAYAAEVGRPITNLYEEWFRKAHAKGLV